MKSHEHKEASACRCSMIADEPNERCPQHGYVYPPKCRECGRFFIPAPIPMSK